MQVVTAAGVTECCTHPSFTTLGAESLGMLRGPLLRVTELNGVIDQVGLLPRRERICFPVGQAVGQIQFYTGRWLGTLLHCQPLCRQPLETFC